MEALNLHAANAANEPVAAPYFLSIDQILDMPSPKWLVKDLLPLGGVGVLYGASGSLKSFFALHLACCVAIGREAFVGRICGKVNSFYVAAEGASGMKLRVSAWMKYHEDKPEGMYLRPQPVYINEKDTIDTFINEIKKIIVVNKQCFIVIDTLSANFTGNENTDDMAQFLRRCGEISKATNATILVVHHTGKDEKREERGHYSLRANADFSLRMNLSDSDNAVSVQAKKLKDAPLGKTLWLRKESVEVEPGAEFSSSLVLVEETGLDKAPPEVLVLTEALDLGDGTTQQELTNNLIEFYKWDRSKASREIRKALPEDREIKFNGVIMRRTGKGKGQRIISVVKKITTPTGGEITMPVERLEVR